MPHAQAALRDHQPRTILPLRQIEHVPTARQRRQRSAILHSLFGTTRLLVARNPNGALAGALVIDIPRIIVGIEVAVAFGDDVSSEPLLAVEDGAAEGGALDGHVGIGENVQVDVGVGHVVGNAVDVVIVEVQRWESGVAIDEDQIMFSFLEFRDGLFFSLHHAMQQTYPRVKELRSRRSKTLPSLLEAALVRSEYKGADRQNLARPIVNKHIVGIKLDHLRIVNMVKWNS